MFFKELIMIVIKYSYDICQEKRFEMEKHNTAYCGIINFVLGQFKSKKDTEDQYLQVDNFYLQNCL